MRVDLALPKSCPEKGRTAEEMMVLQSYIQACHLRHDDLLVRFVSLELSDLIAFGLDERVELLLGGHDGVVCRQDRARKGKDGKAGATSCLC